jgi:hypothetical protein
MENLSESEKAVPLLSADNYSEFLKIEDMRMLYGFDVKTMLNLYNTSVSSGSPLEDLCDKELEKI